MTKKIFLILLFFSSFGYSSENPIKDIPLSYQGRIRPFESYARLILYEFYRDYKILDRDLKAFHTASNDASPFLFSLYTYGYSFWEDAPLFWFEGKRFSYRELKKNRIEDTALLSKIKKFESFTGAFENTLALSPERPWREQLKNDPNFLMLPGRYAAGEWFALSSLVASANFTAYSDETFRKLQDTFLRLKEQKTAPAELAEALLLAYREIASTPLIKGAQSQLAYPSLGQLTAENWYNKTPLVSLAIFGYVAAAFCLLIRFNFLGLGCLLTAFLLQTLALALRCYILGRPPVSNMFETVIYVPWIAILVSFVIARLYRTFWPLIGSAILGAILLTLLTYQNPSLENVQAVLNSHFWLIVHVLMIVGSYGVLILAGILGHIYLFMRLFKGKEFELERVTKALEQTIYLGVALLIPGTILGGVWAAQSWGRFWDWDPKESWAFISSCIYLIFIHLFRFRLIGPLGLSLGSVIGLGFISFTWYGVNYILGTGLHTYGFGSGSHAFYFLFLAAEVLLLLFVGVKLSLEKNSRILYKL